ncbi:MAG TPA: FAD:protein FMN transferase [Vicinamibacterales bacterium]|nr:FAD:protein FMN transferase [Vicinamibacterales bacterium]
MTSWSRRIVVIAAIASACGGRVGSPHLVEGAAPAMGSDLRLTAWTADEAAAHAAFDAAFREFDRLDALMSVWRAGSDVLRINEAAGTRAVAVSPDVREALRAARQVSEWTGGKFDVTFGPLADLWKFDHQNEDHSVPAADAVRSRLPLIDYRQIEIDDRAGTVFLRRPGMQVHLGGIGKGYAVERAAAILRRAGLADFMIQAGGDLYVAGLKAGRPWRLGINDPRGPDGKSFATLDLTDSTFSTSGDYARSFIKDGIRYHHIIDPSTGQPARGCRSVTIVADSPLLADGLSTGVFLLGPEAGMALIERLPHVEGVIVSAKNEVLISSGLEGKVTLLSQPTDAP